MTRKLETTRGVAQETAGEAALHRLSELALEFDAAAIAAGAESLAERISEGRFYVACVGQFKRGKSTLLNALAGQEVLPAGVVPVTTVPTILRYGERLVARVRTEAAEWRTIPAAAVEDYVSEEENPENTKGVTAIEVFLPSPLLATGMCLVDTPGLGSVFAANAAATHAFIPHIDAAIVLIGADPPLSGDELKLVEAVAREVRDLLFVLNKADRTDEVERAAAMAFAKRVLKMRLGRAVPEIFEVSALDQLEKRGPPRDWPKLLEALEHMRQHSGRSLIREATERGIRRVVGQLLAVVREERGALQRPLEESERRIAGLHETLEQAERAMEDLGTLLSAEQQRLSAVFAARRNTFLEHARAEARQELGELLATVPTRRSGPAYRRAVMHAVQELARAQLAPWLESEASYAEEAFRKTAQRFVDLGNGFLRRLGEINLQESDVLPAELDSVQGLRARSQFQFHVLERLAAPASPLVYLGDLTAGAVGLRGYVSRDAAEFYAQLMEVNTARVQSDVDERVRSSREELETEIKSGVCEASCIAERALERARVARAAGAPAVNAALAQLDAAEREISALLPSQ